MSRADLATVSSAAIAKFVAQWQAENGCVPSAQRIKERFGFSSRAAAWKALQRCEREGYIRITGEKYSRRAEVLKV